MSFFNNDHKDLTNWQLPWTLFWPNGDWLAKMLDKGLVPVLGGVDLVSLDVNEVNKEQFCDNSSEGVRLVLGLARNSPDLPESVAEILGANAFEEFKRSLRPNINIFDSEKSELSAPDANIRLYVGLHNGAFWPTYLEDPSAFMAKVGPESSTGVIYYSDESQKIHHCVPPETLEMVEGGFVAILPDDLAEEGAWGVFEKE